MKNKKILALMLVAFMVFAPAVGFISANTAQAYSGSGSHGGKWNGGSNGTSNTTVVNNSTSNVVGTTGVVGGYGYGYGNGNGNNSFINQFLLYRILGCGGIGLSLIGLTNTSNASLGATLGLCSASPTFGSSILGLGTVL